MSHREDMLSDYDRQPPHVRLYRWLRHRPLWFVRSLWCLVRWLVTGARIDPELYDDRWDVARSIMSVGRGMAECAMGRTYTMRQVLAMMREGR